MRGKSLKNTNNILLSEIHEQKEVIQRLVQKHADMKAKKIRIKELDFHKRHLKRIKRFLFLGCGSSANASLLASYYFEELTEKNCEYEFADEFNTRKAVIEKGTAIFLISQSGQSKDLVIAADIARKKGAFLIVVTNTPGSKLDRLSDITLFTDAGHEKGVAATKSFSSQILLLLFSAIYFADLFGEGIENRRTLFKEISELPERIEGSMAIEAGVAKIAKKIAKKRSLLVSGRKFNYPIALEAAHKIKEIAYIHAEGFASEELRHGAEAILEKGFPVINILPGDSVYKENLVLLKELHKTGADNYVITDKKNKTIETSAKQVVITKKASELLQPFCNLVILQLLAYYLAAAKKIDTSAPRNISKFVA